MKKLEIAFEYLSKELDTNCFKDGAKLVNALKDIMPGMTKRELGLLEAFAACDGSSLLLEAAEKNDAERAIVIKRLAARMKEERFAPEELSRELCLSFLAGITPAPKETEKQKITYKGGNIYVGEVLNGAPNGYGVFTYGNGKGCYEGTWKNCLREGAECKETYPDGRQYIGNFVNNKRAGIGVMTYPDGASYNGEWSDDLYSGEGEYTRADGFKYKGSWGIDGGAINSIWMFPEGAYQKTWVNERAEKVHHPRGIIVV